MKNYLLIFSITSLFSCVSLPAYQQQFVNEDEMQIGSDNIDVLNNNAKTYREGSQGGNQGKSGGGCGCN